MICASPICDQLVASFEGHTSKWLRFNLCARCLTATTKHTVPAAGFISGTDLKQISKSVLDHVKPTRAEQAEAVRFARGSMYPSGNWDDRPCYRMAVLKYGRADRRKHHLLVGRRRAPSVKQIVAAYVHYVLGREVMETGHRYNVFLAGGTFYVRRGVCVPPGRKHEVLLGDSRSAIFRLNYGDFAVLGHHSLQSAEKLGLRRGDRDLAAFIAVAYHRGLSEGRHHPLVTVPKYSMRTGQPGDSVFDVRLPRMAHVPHKYRYKVRRSSGLIGGVWPHELDPPDHFKRTPTTPVKTPPLPPATDWLFNQA